jgi:hypothetical protein
MYYAALSTAVPGDNLNEQIAMLPVKKRLRFPEFNYAVFIGAFEFRKMRRQGRIYCQYIGHTRFFFFVLDFKEGTPQIVFLPNP